MRSLLLVLCLVWPVAVSAQTPIADAVLTIDVRPVGMMGHGPQVEPSNVHKPLLIAAAFQVGDIVTSCVGIHRYGLREGNPNQSQNCLGIATVKVITYTAVDLAIHWREKKNPKGAQRMAWAAVGISAFPVVWNIRQIAKARK